MKRIDHRFMLFAITLGAFALRIVRLDFQPLWWDEGYSLFFATRDFGTMLARTAVDIHPPLYYALLQFWIAFAGKGEVAVRLLSVVIGVATIPLLYALAYKLFDNRRVALIAALLLALSPFHVYYSQEVRMYGLVTLLCLASVYLFVQLLGMPFGKPRTIIVAGAYILVTAAALYTQYYAVFILAVEISALAIRAIRSRWLIGSLVHWFIALIAIAAFYLPWVLYAGGKLYTYVKNKVAIEQYAPLDPATFLAQHLAAFSLGHLTDWTWLAWGSTIFVALAIGGAATLDRRDTESAMDIRVSSPRLSGELCLLYLLLPLALGYIVNLIYPFHPIRNERLLLIAAPAFWILVALGIDALWHRRAWLAALALVVVAALSAASLYDFYVVPRYPNDDYRPLIAELQALAQPGDAFLAIYPWQIGYMETYYAGAPLDITETPSDAWNNNSELMQRALDALRTSHPRVWFAALQTQGHILEDKLEAYLRPRDYAVVDDWFGTTRLEMYDAAADPPAADRPIGFDSEHTDFSPKRWGISTSAVTAGQDLVRLWFDNGNVAPETIKVSLRLVDPGGNLWAQDDRQVTNGMQRIGFAIPAGTPPGKYDLRLAPYPARDVNYDSTQSQVTLGTLQVVAPPQPKFAAVPNRRTVDFGNGIYLVGYQAPPTVRPGDPTPVTLFWQATRTVRENYALVLQVQDDRGNIYEKIEIAPAYGIYPMTRWLPGEIVRDPETLTLRADTPDGNYHLVATLLDRADPSSSQTRVVGTVNVSGRMHYFGAPSPSQKTDVRFDNTARLVGVDLSKDSRGVRLILYWQALALTPTSYTVFVHVVDVNGNAVAYGDAVPGNGTLPTTSWVANEYLADLHEFSVPPNVPPGEYEILVGIYNPKTGARLPVVDSSGKNIGDHIRLPTRITVP